MSAWGWPEPSTGIRLPRGQCGQACSSRVSEFSSRIARSRYFSRISSSVTGIDPEGFDGARTCPWRCTLTCACGRPSRRVVTRRARCRSPAGRRRAWPCVCRNFSACTYSRLVGRVRMSASRSDCRNSCRPVEVAHPDPHRAEALGDVRVRARARDDPVLGGEARGLLVERPDRHARVEDLDRVDVVEDRQQVLVVGDRVHPVERMRHVHEAALALDLGDRLLEASGRGGSSPR